MTTRLNVPVADGQEQLPTGYDLENNDPSTFFIPSCGFEDADVAVHTLFAEDIPFRAYQGTSNYEKEVNIKKPFVKFASGERFALAKALKPFRDTRTGALLLPAISIRRTGIEQQNGDVFPGELTIKRRLDSSDKDYQSLINRLLLKNVGDNPTTSRQNVGVNATEQSIREGMLLDLGPERLRADHIYETIVIPFPQFYTATYEVVFWTNYIQHMNYMLETLLSSQIAPGKGFHLKTNKGYWFGANVDPTLTTQDNYEEITDVERLTKYSFNLIVRAYLLGTNGPGHKVPFKRYLSAVNIAFESYVVDSQPYSQTDIDQYEGTKTGLGPYVLTDLERDPVTQQRATEQEKVVFEKNYRDSSGRTQTKYVKQVASNQRRGETAYTASDQEALEAFFADSK